MIPIDKLKHFFYATLIGFVLINLFVWVGFWICIAGFAFKEVVWDGLMKKGTPELDDFLYGVASASLILITKLDIIPTITLQQILDLI